MNRVDEIRQYLADTQPKSNDGYATQDIAKLRSCCKRMISEYDHIIKKVPADELQAAIDEAESIKDSIIGGSNFAPYMYAYLSLRGSIQKMLESEMKSGAKMEREGK